MFFGKTNSAKSVSTRKHRCLFQPHCFAYSVIFHQLKAAVLLQIFGEQGLTDTGSDLNAAAQILSAIGLRRLENGFVSSPSQLKST
jgi:hypothetical protein